MTKENMPPHMHHSGITTGASMSSMQGREITSPTNVNNRSSTRYDMFRNDSFSTGLSDNEMNGVWPEFQVHEVGDVKVQHENMPKYESYYAFIISKNVD